MSSYSKKQKNILTLFSSGMFFNGVCWSLQAPFYPAVAESKHMSKTEYGFVFGIFQLVIFISSPIYGRFISKIGLKFMYNAGYITLGYTCILFGMLNYVDDSNDFMYLSFAIRIVEGLGSSAFFTATFSIIGKEFISDAAAAFAIVESFFGFGLIVGPAVGGALYEVGGFYLPFVSMGALLILSAIFTLFLMPTTESIDQVYGPSLILKMMKIPTTSQAAITVISAGISILFLDVTLEPHLRPLGLSAGNVGLMFVIVGGISAATGPLWGKLCDRGVSPKLIIMFGSLASAIAFLIVGPAPFLHLEKSLGLCIVALCIEGLGFGTQMVAGFAASHKDALASGMPDSIETFGLVSAVWTASMALGSFIGGSCGGALTEAFGFNWACLFLVVFHCAISIMMFVDLLFNIIIKEKNVLLPKV